METIWKSFLDLFEEIYIGSADSQTWIIDGQPGHGFTTVIKDITADVASKPIVKGGTSIVGHAEHLRWSLNFALQFFEGKTPNANWEESWKLRAVNTPAWESVQLDLIDAYEAVKAQIAAREDWSNPEFLKGTLALLPHAAYHLGAIKQMILVLTKESAH